MLTVAVPKRNKLPNIIVLTPKDGDEFKPNKGKKVDENYVESINNTVTNKIRFSDQILKTDYYRVVFGDYQ